MPKTPALGTMMATPVPAPAPTSKPSQDSLLGTTRPGPLPCANITTDNSIRARKLGTPSLGLPSPSGTLKPLASDNGFKINSRANCTK